jgi:prolyl-tRNA editing enzyme YbaK/EbsC (Cys-tRNA(Pro) deacylase)
LSPDVLRASEEERSRRLEGFAGYAAAVVERRWPDEVERVAAFLRESGVESRVEEFSDGTPTAEDAARAAGCELAQIVKSLVFDCDGRSIVVLVPGDRRADRHAVATTAGCGKAKIAGPEQVLAATGFTPGAVAPFPLPNVDRVYVDRSLLQHQIVWVGAGSSRHMASLAPTDLVRLAQAEPMDAVEHRT